MPREPFRTTLIAIFRAAACSIIAAATSSQRQRIQRLGRALRKAEGKPTAVIYSLFATASEASSLRVESERVSEIAEIKWTSVNSLVSDENN